jgi:hypothetical protein
MTFRRWFEAVIDPGHTPDVVEDNVVIRVVGNDSARLEHPTGDWWPDEVGKLVLGDQDDIRARLACLGQAGPRIMSSDRVRERRESD